MTAARMSVTHGPHHIVPSMIRTARNGKKDLPKINPRCVANFFIGIAPDVMDGNASLIFSVLA